MSMDPAHSAKRSFHPVPHISPSLQLPTEVGTVQGSSQERGTHIRSGLTHREERSGRSQGQVLPRLLQQAFHSSEEKRKPASHPRSVTSEPVHTDRAVQREPTRSIRDIIRVNDWAVSIDLQDGYLHVPMAPSTRKFLRFVSEDRVYQFCVLPFGIATAPRVFTKLMEKIAAEARKRGISIIQYLDDWLLHHQSRAALLRNLGQFWKLIVGLGLIPNIEKSELVPTQDFCYVGMNFLTNQGIVRVPQDRISRILTLVFSVVSATSAKRGGRFNLFRTLTPQASTDLPVISVEATCPTVDTCHTTFCRIQTSSQTLGPATMVPARCSNVPSDTRTGADHRRIRIGMWGASGAPGDVVLRNLVRG